MNREQRRRAEKALRHSGKTREQARQIVNEFEFMHPVKKLSNGDKVKLNVAGIKSDVNFKRKTDEYKTFVDTHQDDVFTVELDPKFHGNAILVCLAEDETEPKWLWHESDLERV